jgi:hypothetical protein
MKTEATVFDILKLPEGLVRFLPVRVLLRKGEDGTLEGYCEDSFSMSWVKNRARIYWSGTAYSNFGSTHQLDAVKDIQQDVKEGYLVVDPIAEDSPIKVDWERWLKATGKYDKRNAHFKIAGELK